MAAAWLRLRELREWSPVLLFFVLDGTSVWMLIVWLHSRTSSVERPNLSLPRTSATLLLLLDEEASSPPPPSSFSSRVWRIRSAAAPGLRATRPFLDVAPVPSTIPQSPTASRSSS